MGGFKKNNNYKPNANTSKTITILDPEKRFD